MKNTSQSKKNSGREYISYNTNRVIIFGTDGSKFKLGSVFEFARHGRALTDESSEHAQIVGSV